MIFFHLLEHVLEHGQLIRRPDVNRAIVADLIHERFGEFEIRESFAVVEPLAVLDRTAGLANRVATPLKPHLFVRPHPNMVGQCDPRTFEVDEVERVGVGAEAFG